MGKKNILIFSVAYYPMVGGAEVAWKEITDRLGYFEFDMVTPRFKRSLPSYEKIGNVNVYRIGFGNIFDKLMFPITGAIAGFFLNRKKNYSLTIGIMYNHAGLAASFFKILKPEIPFVLNLQDGDTDEVIDKNTRGIKSITRMIYRKPDAITVIAKFLKERALKNGSTPDISLIPNGVDLNIFDAKTSREELASLRADLGLSPATKTIITTSRLNYKNAIDDLILSLKFLSDDYRLLILGNGEDEEKLRKLTAENGLEKNVVFLGYKKHSEIAKYLQISDVFCRPSLQEGLGNSFLEAMMAGIPVVATPVGGIPDFLIDGETGLFCEVRNPKSIAEKIKVLCENNDLRNKIIENSKKLIKKNYDWDLTAEKYDALFKKIDAQRPKTPKKNIFPIIISLLALLMVFYFGSDIRGLFDKNPPMEQRMNRVMIYDTNGSEEEDKWIAITGINQPISSPENILIQNGLIRIVYNKYANNIEQLGSHSWYLKNQNNQYEKITDSHYGDYVYYVNSITTSPTKASLIEVSADKVIVDFYFENHTAKHIAKKDGIVEGKRPFIKRIEMDSNMYGAYLNYISDDPDPTGEREFSLGMGKNIMYGTSGNWIWDASLKESRTTRMPKSDYYLGFPNESAGYYYMMKPPKNFKISMYKFENAWGGPIVQHFIESKNSKGIFLGLVPYRGKFSHEAEFLPHNKSSVVENMADAKNNSALKLAIGEKIIIFPENTFPKGSYRITLRQKGSASSIEIYENDKKHIEKIQGSEQKSFINTSIGKTIEYDPAENDAYYIVLRNGDMLLDNLYFIPIESGSETFPKDIAKGVKS